MTDTHTNLFVNAGTALLYTCTAVQLGCTSVTECQLTLRWFEDARRYHARP
jgi:hypothetical protein